jgi:two-component SAPR family response regulator
MHATEPPDHAFLQGCRVLIAEDMYLLASDLMEEVARLGGEVIGPCSRVEEALAALEREDADLALLDVNLEDAPVFPVAEALLARGVPFAFLTGYAAERMPPRWRGILRLEKPLDPARLAGALRRLMRRRRA